MGYDKNALIYIEKDDELQAAATVKSFADKQTRSRTYTNALGAQLAMKYLASEKINVSDIHNIHSIKKVLEEFDIADIMLPNIHIDVRVVFDENFIFIPKTHFEYDILPDIYLALQIAEDEQYVKLLGFFEPKLINKNNHNDEYYFIEKEKLSSPSDLKKYIKDFKGDTYKSLSESEIEKCENLIISMEDNDISNSDKKYLLKKLTESAILRDKFIEYENFELLSNKSLTETDNQDKLKDYEPENHEEISSALIDEIDVPSDEENQEEENKTADTEEQPEEELTDDFEIEENLEAIEEISDMPDEISETDDIFAEELLKTENSDVEDILLSDNENTEDEVSFDEENSDDEFDNLLENSILDDEITQEEPENEKIEITDDVVFEELNEKSEENDLSGNTAEEDTDTKSELTHENSGIAGDIAGGIAGGIIGGIAGGIAGAAAEGLAENIAAETLNITDLPQIDFNTIEENISSAELKEENYDNETISLDNSTETSITDTDNTEETTIDEDLVSLDEINIQEPEIEPNEITENFEEDYLTLSDDNENNLHEDFQDKTYNEEYIENQDETGEEINKEADETFDITEKTADEITEEPQDEIEQVKEENISAFDQNDINDLEDFIDDTMEFSEEQDNKVLEMVNEYLPDYEPETHENINEDTNTDNISSDELLSQADELINTNIATENSEDKFEDVQIEQIGVSEQTDMTEQMPVDELPVLNESANEDIPEYTASETQYSETDLQTQHEEISAAAAEEEEEEEEEEKETVLASDDNDTVNENPYPNNFSEEAPQSDEQVMFNNEADTEFQDNNEEKLGILYSENGEIPAENLSELQNTEETDNKPLYKIPGIAFLEKSPLIQNKKLLITAAAIALVMVTTSAMILLKPKNDTNVAETPQTTETTADVQNPDINQENPFDGTNNIASNTPDISQNDINKKTTDIKNSAKSSQSSVSKSSNKDLSVSKIVWDVPGYLSYSKKFQIYLNTAGKSIKSSLSVDLLLATEYAYSNRVKVSVKLNSGGNVEAANIVISSGSQQIDKIVLQCVKDTLNVVKPPVGEIKGDSYNLGLIINL